MRESIIEVSRQFFEEVLLPILLRDFPEETEQTAFGVFGYGSEVMGMDDRFSSDYHWGIRVNAVMPDALYYNRGYLIAQSILPHLPDHYRGYDVRAGFSGGTGLSITGLESYLKMTIGIDHAPQSYAEWLSAPEEDIVHVINGEVWLDELGQFSHIRKVLQGYYPEPVRLRRIAHWCRYFSGMGSYALKRALLRGNEYYATIAFSRAVVGQCNFVSC